MFPCCSVDNMSNIARSNIKQFGYFVKVCYPTGVQLANFYNILLRKFFHTMLHPNRSGAMPLCVVNIALAGIPPEIIKAIFQSIAILMASLKTWWAWAYENLKNHLMDTSIMSLTILLEHYLYIARGPDVLGEESLGIWGKNHAASAPCSFTHAFPITPYPAVIRNFVARETRNRFPLFLIWIKLVITHGKNLLERFLLWGEPGRCLRTAFGSFNYTATHRNCKEFNEKTLAPVPWVA